MMILTSEEVDLILPLLADEVSYGQGEVNNGEADNHRKNTVRKFRALLQKCLTEEDLILHSAEGTDHEVLRAAKTIFKIATNHKTHVSAGYYTFTAEFGIVLDDDGTTLGCGVRTYTARSHGSNHPRLTDDDEVPF